MNKRRLGAGLMALGAILLAAAALLVRENHMEETEAGDRAQAVLGEMQRRLNLENGRILPKNVGQTGEESAPQIAELPTMEIDGDEYIGMIELPTLDRSLPVMKDWSYPKLRRSPCRYWGSPEKGNFVIFAHNYSRHFGSIRDLATGDPVQFVSVDCRVYRYSVEKIETLEKGDVDKMLNSGYDLTLFTCTYGGRHRVTVRLSRVYSYE